MRAGTESLADRELEVSRLRALIRRLEAEPPSGRRPTPRPGLALEQIATPHGMALRHVEQVRAPEILEDEGLPVPGSLYLDTETTGLSGGTGTYVFLVGLATWTGRDLTISQYFLGDLDGEPAFLHAVAEAVAEAGQLITFNGRTFDLPLLETRYLLARAGWWGLDRAHLDLYPVARALWAGRAANCRLTTLEAALLGLDRGDDLPGALVPQVYFRYLRTQDPGALPRVFAHNRWDLVALAALHARATSLLGGPDPRHDPDEWVGAGRWFERREPHRSASFYEAALQAGLPASVAPRVAWRLGWLWRRAGRVADARALWADAVARSERPPLRLLVDLAKLQEHHARDFGAALDTTRAALAAAEAWALDGGQDDVDALERRAQRLTRRLARALAPAPRRARTPAG